jgi:hypothetical protein
MFQETQKLSKQVCPDKNKYTYKILPNNCFFFPKICYYLNTRITKAEHVYVHTIQHKNTPACINLTSECVQDVSQQYIFKKNKKKPPVVSSDF